MSVRVWLEGVGFTSAPPVRPWALTLPSGLYNFPRTDVDTDVRIAIVRQQQHSAFCPIGDHLKDPVVSIRHTNPDLDEKSLGLMNLMMPPKNPLSIAGG